MQARADSFFGMGGGECRSLGPTLILSAVAHLVLFLMIATVSGYQPARKHLSSVINVDLVSFPAKAPAFRPRPSAPAPAKAHTPSKQVQRPEPQKTAPPVPPTMRPRPESMPSDAVSVAPAQKQSKTALKSKTYKPNAIVKNAIKRIETDTEQSRPRVVQQAIESLKARVKNQKEPFQPQISDEGSDLPEQVGTHGEEGGGNTPATSLGQMDIYKLELTYYIEKNWAFSEQMAGGNTLLEAVLVIKIMPDGQINDIWFEKKSGNGYFDDSVYKAVVKSNPLPPLPKGFSRPYFNVGLIFTPSGLK